MDPVDTRIDLDPGKRPNGMDLSHWCMLSVILLTKYGENRLITVWEIMLEDVVKMLYRIMYVEKLPYPHPDSDQFQNLTNALFEDHPTPIPTKFRWHLADRRTHRHTNTHAVITVHTLPRAQVQTLKGGLPGRSPSWSLSTLMTTYNCMDGACAWELVWWYHDDVWITSAASDYTVGHKNMSIDNKIDKYWPIFTRHSLV